MDNALVKMTSDKNYTYKHVHRETKLYQVYFFDSVDLECTFDIKLVENSVVCDLKVDCCERGRQTIWKTKHLDELVLILLNKHDDVPFME